jgi:hypothetical protein
MPGSTTLAWLLKWFDAQLVSSVFEPLLADWQREIAANRSSLLRARWWGAIALTVLQSLPRAAFGGLRGAFVLALAGRAAAFLTLAFAVQWLFGIRLSPRSDAQAWPPSFATTFFFMMTPVIWRVRREAIPVQQQRLITIAFLMVCVAGAWVAAGADLTLGAAMFLGAAWLTFSTWRIFTAVMYEHLPVTAWVTGVYPATAIIIASVPVKLALGISLWRPWWHGDNMTPFLVGLVIGMTAGGIQLPDALYRHFYKRMPERLVTDRRGPTSR